MIEERQEKQKSMMQDNKKINRPTWGNDKEEQRQEK